MKILPIFLLLFVMFFAVGCSKENLASTSDDGNTAEQPQVQVPVTQTVPNTAAKTGYSGTILAGNITPYIEFNTQDYNKATSDGKVILLYFYSDVGPLSKSEEYKIFRAFDDMGSTKMIGFKVHFGDTVTTEAEKQLADSLGVKDARTKVILKDGIVKQKSTTSWDISTYAIQMSQYLD